jgi:hypothetical protein
MFFCIVKHASLPQKLKITRQKCSEVLPSGADAVVRPAVNVSKPFTYFLNFRGSR